jgi:hypothetical protein
MRSDADGFESGCAIDVVCSGQARAELLTHSALV